MEEEKEIKANIVNQMRNLLNVCMAKKDYDHQRKKKLVPWLTLKVPYLFILQGVH